MAINIPNVGSHVAQIDALLLVLDLRTELDHGLRLTRSKQYNLKSILVPMHRMKRHARPVLAG